MKKNDFIINGKVVYDRYKGTLANIADKNAIVSLQNPANQCLAILIEKQPEIVNQDYFFYHVWEKNGLPVNVNTFYQSISLVRKALKSVGMDEDIIKTTPRLGISIPEYIDIVATSNEEQQNSPDSIKSPEIKEQTVINADSLNNNDSPDTNNNVKNDGVILNKYKYIFSLVILIFSAALTYLITDNLEKGAFSEYSYYGKYKNCEIYTPNGWSPMGHIVEVANKLEISCETDSSLYYSTTRGVHIDSIFHCGKSSCVSYYYVDARRQIYEKN